MRLVTEEELADMTKQSEQVSTGDRWLRLCREVRRLWAQKEAPSPCACGFLDVVCAECGDPR